MFSLEQRFLKNYKKVIIIGQLMSPLLVLLTLWQSIIDGQYLNILSAFIASVLWAFLWRFVVLKFKQSVVRELERKKK